MKNTKKEGKADLCPEKRKTERKQTPRQGKRRKISVGEG